MEGCQNFAVEFQPRDVLAELSVRSKAIRLAKRFRSVTDEIGNKMEMKLQDAKNNNTGGRIRTRSGNVLVGQSRIEKVIRSSFLFKLREASVCDLEKLTFSKAQFGAAKRYAVAWKARIKRKIAKRAKKGTGGRKKRRTRAGTSSVTMVSRRRRNRNLNQPRS